MKLRELVFFSLEKGGLGGSYKCVWSQIEMQEVSFKHNYFTVRLVKQLEQVTQRGFGVSILEEDDQSLTGHGPEQLALVHPAVSRVLH